MKKNIIKIILDVIMSVLLFLMYSKNVINISFHELGGLIVCGLFIIHMGLNRKWIVVISKRLFDKSLRTKTKIGYVVNLMLLISMSFIAVSGIMISKTLFNGAMNGGGFWKMGHYFASAMAIIFVGIHIGLHWSFIKNMFKKILKIPPSVAKPLGVLCLVAMLAYGGYSSATSDFAKWLISPFTMSTVQKGERPQKFENSDGTKVNGERPEGMPQKGERPEGMADGTGGGQDNGSLNFGRIFALIATYGSITSIFATITLFIEKLLKRKKSVIPKEVK